MQYQSIEFSTNLDLDLLTIPFTEELWEHKRNQGENTFIYRGVVEKVQAIQEALDLYYPEVKVIRADYS